MKNLSTLVLTILILLPMTAAVAGPPEAVVTKLIHLEKFGVSRPLRDIPSAPRAAGVLRIRPNFDIPLSAEDVAIRNDEALQTSSFLTPQAPTTGANFMGVGEGLGSYNAIYVPPDTIGEAGLNHYVQTVNTDLGIFTKNGSIVPGFPKPINTLWSGFGGACETRNDGDPTVTYDQFANRWIIAQFTSAKVNRKYYECVAVSTTSDPTGSYYLYAYSFSNFPDYPKLAVWPSSDSYFATYNIFGGTFKGAMVCAMQRSKLIAGQSNTQVCKQLTNSYYSLLAADLDGNNPLPAGTDEYVVSAYNGVKFWRFHVDWGTLTGTMSGPTSITVAGYSEACAGASSGSCIPQKGTSVQLDSLRVHVMNRLAYRVFTGTGAHDSLVANHTVSASGINGVRWYELRPSGGTLTVSQQGTYSPGSDHRWMGSIAMDKMGNIGVGYSASSGSINPAIRYAGWTVGDSPGVLSGETTIIAGTGSQTQYSRWGDYSSMTPDPVDDCTMWYTTEYLTANGSFNWSTRIASFKFPNCN